MLLTSATDCMVFQGQLKMRDKDTLEMWWSEAKCKTEKILQFGILGHPTNIFICYVNLRFEAKEWHWRLLFRIILLLEAACRRQKYHHSRLPLINIRTAAQTSAYLTLTLLSIHLLWKKIKVKMWLWPWNLVNSTAGLCLSMLLIYKHWMKKQLVHNLLYIAIIFVFSYCK